jgi:hypothetical protein
MKRIFKVITIVFVIGVMLNLVFSNDAAIDMKQYSTAGLSLNYTVSLEADVKADNKIAQDAMPFFSPLLDRSYVGFKEALGFKESRGKYACVNTLGYLGKYQFGRGTLKLIGIFNTSEFLNSPELQEKAFLANARRNKWILRRDIKNFVGKRIDGILITESGIIAAAHLSGPGNVKRYLRSYGALGFSDAYGTTVRAYMKKFSSYDVSFIKQDRKAKAI